MLWPSPLDSIRDDVLTVSPNRQYRGIFRPTTPAHTGPATHTGRRRFVHKVELKQHLCLTPPFYWLHKFVILLSLIRHLLLLYVDSGPNSSKTKDKFSPTWNYNTAWMYPQLQYWHCFTPVCKTDSEDLTSNCSSWNRRQSFLYKQSVTEDVASSVSATCALRLLPCS